MSITGRDGPSGAARWLAWVVAAPMIGAAAATATDTLVWTLRAWSPAPYLDQWETVAELMRLKAGSPLWTEIWRSHNEHRILFPRLFLYLDYERFGGANRLMTPVTVAIQAFHAGFLVWVCRPREPARAGQWPAYVAVAAFVVLALFSLGQFENYFWRFQIAFVGVFAAVTAGYFLLAEATTRSRADGRWKAPLIGGVVLLVVATYTLANGLLAGPIAVLLLVQQRANWRLVAITAVTVALSTVLFFHDYVGGSGGSLAPLAKDPERAFRYITAFMGSLAAPAFTAPERIAYLEPVCIALGTVGLMLSTAAGGRLLLGRDRDPRLAALVALMVFIVASAAVTAGGRMNYFSLQQAMSSRYVTPSAVFWSVQALYWFAVTARRGAVARWIVVAATAVLAGVILTAQIGVRPTVREWIAKVDWGTDALMSRVDDPDALRGIAFDPAVAAQRSGFLEAQGLSVYGEPQMAWLGRRLDSVARIAPAADCLGRIEVVGRGPEVTGDALRAEGWAWSRHGRVRRIILTGGRGAVRGFGSMGLDHPPTPGAAGAHNGWRAMGRGRNGDTLRAFAETGEGTVCELDRIVLSGMDMQTALGAPPPARIGAVIPAAAGGEGIFFADGHPKEAGAPPGPAYGSWAGSDLNTGAVMFGPFAPKGREIAFGLVTGVHPGKAVIQVVDAGTGAVLTQVKPRVRTAWTWVSLPVEAGRSVRLIARDGGRQLGEWLAVTTPFEVNP